MFALKISYKIVALFTENYPSSNFLCFIGNLSYSILKLFSLFQRIFIADVTNAINTTVPKSLTENNDFSTDSAI